MSKLVEPGQYEAKIIGYQLGTAKSGTPQAELLFQFQDHDGDTHQLTWYGYFTEKASEITIRALVTCGLKGQPWDISNGPESSALDMDTPVQIDVIREPKQNSNDTYAKIQWINRLGGSKFRAPGMTKDQARVKLAALGLEGLTAKVRKEVGKVTPMKKKEQEFSQVEDEDLDFLEAPGGKR